MKINYNLEMEKILEQLKKENKVPTLLLHSCCAPCSSYVITTLMPYFDITVIYYNPNIEPQEEYEKRKEEQKKLLALLKSPHKLDFIDCDYDNALFHQMALNLEQEKEGGIRCFKCYELRLNYTALKALENHYDYFGTTLTVSPYKNSQKLNEIGLALASKYKVKYLVSDFKKKDGYKKSIELSHKYNLYRQNYCGCIYSKKED